MDQYAKLLTHTWGDFAAANTLADLAGNSLVTTANAFVAFRSRADREGARWVLEQADPAALEFARRKVGMK
ncbi:MAG: hypothetical protein ACPGR8_06370 [Limisphaerales bacterium]